LRWSSVALGEREEVVMSSLQFTTQYVFLCGRDERQRMKTEVPGRTVMSRGVSSQPGLLLSRGI
jgi:hypothetical protein